MSAHRSFSCTLRVFLCHSSSDKVSVRNLYRRLKRSGFLPWLDEQNLVPGQRWDEEIKKAVRQCDVVIVCLSKGSVTKEGYVQKEIRIALDIEEEKPEGAIFIIPVLLEEVRVPERLKDWQYAQLFHKDGYNKLVRALKIRFDQISAQRGDAFAMYRLGLRHLREGAEQDYSEAFRWIEMGAQAGHTGAMNQLGLLYLQGLGVTQNDQRARECLEKAANSGDAYAMYNLALIYIDGRGVSQNYECARHWLERAANAGHAAAMNYVGILYNNSLGVRRDYDEARKWQEKAASAGNPAAMYNLGITFEKGRGVTQDLSKARYWFELAIKAGNQNARKRLSEMKGAVPPKQEANPFNLKAHAETPAPATAQKVISSNASYSRRPSVHLQLARFEVERMRDQFKFNNPELYTLLHHAILTSYQQEAQSATVPQDPAKVPVSIELAEQDMTAILKRYEHLSGPTDGNIYQAVSQANARYSEFEAIKFSIFHCRITNRLFPLLHSLREFFFRHQELLRLEPNGTFFEKWLVHPMVEMNIQGSSTMWTAERVAELHSELGLIQT